MMPPGMAQMSMMHNNLFGMGPGPYGMMMGGDQVRIVHKYTTSAASLAYFDQ